jgi:hypothetical protein
MSIERRGGRWAIALIAMLSLALVVGGASPAVAGKKIKTKVEIKKLSTSGASGKVSSKEDSCIPHRKISLFTWNGYSADKIAITNTDSHGNWKVNRDLKPDTQYFAKVDAKGKCGYDNSPFERLGG